MSDHAAISAAAKAEPPPEATISSHHIKITSDWMRWDACLGVSVYQCNGETVLVRLTKQPPVMFPHHYNRVIMLHRYQRQEFANHYVLKPPKRLRFRYFSFQPHWLPLLASYSLAAAAFSTENQTIA